MILYFHTEEKRKSEAATTSTVHSININQVGAFALHADRSVIQGSVEATTSTTMLSQSTLDLVQQVEALLPASKLPVEIQGATQAALGELKREATADAPDSGRLRRGLESLKKVLAQPGKRCSKLRSMQQLQSYSPRRERACMIYTKASACSRCGAVFNRTLASARSGLP